MKSYHKAPEQAAQALQQQGHSPDTGGMYLVSSQAVANAINAALDQVLGEPIGYIDLEQITRWEKLRGTEFEQEERAYIGFSTKPFKTKMTDCTLAVYAAPKGKL